MVNVIRLKNVPREYQDYAFVVREAENRVITRLVGSVFGESPDTSPCVVFARFADPPEWHRFFVQAHIGFWEIWDDAKIEEELEECLDAEGRIVDFASMVGGLPRLLHSAKSMVGKFDASNIRLMFDNGMSFTLSSDSADLDTNFHVHSESEVG